MKDDPNGRRPKWKTTTQKMEDEHTQKWKMTSPKNGRRRHLEMEDYLTQIWK